MRLATLFTVATLALAGAPAVAEDLAALLRSARFDRHNGDFAGAITALERARALVPGDADVLLLLGQTQGFAERYEEALATLEQARARAPDYIDVRLAIVRVHFYRGAHAAAEAELAALRPRAPGDPRLELLGGRVALGQGDLMLAKARFARARALEPAAAAPLAGLADVAMADGDPFAAVDLYERALERSPDDAGLFDRLLRARGEARRWRIESDVALSRFEDERAPWREVDTRITSRRDARTALTGAIEAGERFRRRDLHLEVGAAHRASARWSGYVAAGVTPAPDYRERAALRGGGALHVRQGGDRFGPTLLTLDARYADYAEGATVTLTPGAEQYLLNGMLTLAGRWINVIEEDGRHLDGPLVRVDLRPGSGAVLHGGVAAAPESQGRQVVDTYAFFGGIALAFDQTLVARTQLLRETRQSGAARTAVTVGFGVEF